MLGGVCSELTRVRRQHRPKAHSFVSQDHSTAEAQTLLLTSETYVAHIDYFPLHISWKNGKPVHKHLLSQPSLVQTWQKRRQAVELQLRSFPQTWS